MAALLIGYARCPTDQQDLTAQHDGLTALGVAPDRIYVDRTVGRRGTHRGSDGVPPPLTGGPLGPRCDPVDDRAAGRAAGRGAWSALDDTQADDAGEDG